MLASTFLESWMYSLTISATTKPKKCELDESFLEDETASLAAFTGKPAFGDYRDQTTPGTLSWSNTGTDLYNAISDNAYELSLSHYISTNNWKMCKYNGRMHTHGR